MKYLLDTNVCVNAIHQGIPKFNARFILVPPQEKAICSVVRYELFYGAYKSQRRSTSLPIIEAFLSNYVNLGFDENAARICGELRAVHQSCRTRRSIPIHDCPIEKARPVDCEREISATGSRGRWNQTTDNRRGR